jgi:hypothetical protein
METFVDTIPDRKVRERLLSALNRRSPFRNFKDEVETSHVRTAVSAARSVSLRLAM